MRHERAIYFTCDVCTEECASGSAICVKCTLPGIDIPFQLIVPSSDCGDYSDEHPDLCPTCLAATLCEFAENLLKQETAFPERN